MNLLSILATEAHHAHEGGDWWTEFLGLWVDPAHLLFELTFTIVFDFLIIAVIYRVIILKLIVPRLRREIHAEIDAEHGIAPHGNEKGEPHKDSPDSV